MSLYESVFPNCNTVISPPPMVPPQDPKLPQKDVSDRGRMRMLKLKIIEEEQRLREAEELKMTAEQRQTLLMSFSSVKFEFTDLDGLSWSAPEPSLLLQRWHQSQQLSDDELTPLPKPDPLGPSATPNSPTAPVFVRARPRMNANDKTIRAPKTDKQPLPPHFRALSALPLFAPEENRALPSTNDLKALCSPPEAAEDATKHDMTRASSMPVLSVSPRLTRSTPVQSRTSRASECGAMRRSKSTHRMTGLAQRASPLVGKCTTETEAA